MPEQPEIEAQPALNTAQRKVGFLTTMQWWALFVIATVGLSWWLNTFKTFTYTPTWSNAFPCIVAFGLLIGTFTMLLFDSYVKEKIKGNVHHPFKLFEWLDRVLGMTTKLELPKLELKGQESA